MTTEIYTLSLHDALPIFDAGRLEEVAHEDAVFVGRLLAPRGEAPVRAQLGVVVHAQDRVRVADVDGEEQGHGSGASRSEEHTSELQSQSNLVCRLLLEKK